MRDTVHWHALTVAETLERLGTSLDGLATREAERRFQQFGPNEIETAPSPSLLRIILHQFKSPLIYILLVAALVTAGLGEWIDTGAIFAVLLINAALGTYHELRAEQAIRSLMLYLSPRARVIRDGVEREIPAKSLVPGDIVLLEQGSAFRPTFGSFRPQHSW